MQLSFLNEFTLDYPVKKENPNSTIRQCIRLQETWLESAKAYSMAVMRLAPAPLLWVQWLSGKSVRLVIRRSQVRFPAGSLWIVLSLSPKLTASYS